MKYFFILILFYLGAVTSSAQISLLPSAIEKEQEYIPKYDSITNFMSGSDYRYLKGQSLVLLPDSYYSKYSSNLKILADNSSVDESVMIGKCFRIEDVRAKDSYGYTLILRDTATQIVYQYSGYFDKARWIVMGYYDKMKETYVGKDLILMKYESIDITIYKDYPIYKLSTHAAIKDIELKTRWKCTGLSVDMDAKKTDVTSRVILLIENEKYGQCYCYINSASNILNEKNVYKKGTYSPYYIADKFMPGAIYDKQQQQIKAKKQAAEAAEQKERMEKVARQKAAAESKLKRLQKK